jgi:hypothetical protein
MFAGSNPAEAMDLWGRYKFAVRLPSERKQSRGPHVLKILACTKITCKYEQNTSQGQILIPPACYELTMPVGLPESSGGRNRSFPLSTSSFHHVSPCSYRVYHLGNEQWWPQFRDIVSPHRHDRHHQYLVKSTNKRALLNAILSSLLSLHPSFDQIFS